VRFDNLKEVPGLRNRLGHMTMFPYIQPEQSYFEFEMAYHDQRYALLTLLQLAVKESRTGFSNIHNFEYRQSDGSLDPLPLGIPASWTYADKVPATGTFKCTYYCGPEERKVPDRKQYMQQYGFWSGPANESDIRWWTALDEAPVDVVEFLDFLVVNYKDVFEAFTVIDGPDGNGNLSIREFEEGMLRMKCKKFKGKHEKERITNVFRYLDPTGEGQISKDEWGVLVQLFDEIHLSIGEFVWFLHRTFDSLEDAWNFMDDDGSGTLDMKEWMAASQSIGFFGPAEPIFSFLDKDDEDSVSWEEFQLLEGFQAHDVGEASGAHDSNGD
jgi:Ca2+-binding EF-hand superfamily protein